jgi:hypothetical protein
MSNEQPLFADIESMPTAGDAMLVCTNLRLLNGRKPDWTDRVDSWFVIPLVSIRFIEIPRSALGSQEGLVALPGSGFDQPVDLDDEPDADLLRRIRDA